YVSEEWRNRTQAGGKLLEEAAWVRRKGAFAALEPRKRRKTAEDLAADQTKVIAEDVPLLPEISRRVSQRIKAELNAPPPRPEPVSQKATTMNMKFKQIYNLPPKARMSDRMRNTIKGDVTAAYQSVLSDTDRRKLDEANKRQKLASTVHGIAKRHRNKLIEIPKKVSHESDIESVESSTGDLIKQLVGRYAGASTTSPPQDDVDKHEVDVEGNVYQPDEEGKPKARSKRVATPKQKAHLEKTRELALQKRPEYAAQRKAEKEAAAKEAYEAELQKRANEILKAKVSKVLLAQRKEPVVGIVAKTKPVKKKRVIVEEDPWSSSSAGMRT
ncbi:hypothetical protein HDV00_001617, partial [Rhizophlyctis rosea]